MTDFFRKIKSALKTLTCVEVGHIGVYTLEIYIVITLGLYKIVLPNLDLKGTYAGSFLHQAPLLAILTIFIYYYFTSLSLDRKQHIYKFDFMLRSITAFLGPASLFFLLKDSPKWFLTFALLLPYFYLVWDSLYIGKKIEKSFNSSLMILCDILQFSGLIIIILLPMSEEVDYMWSVIISTGCFLTSLFIWPIAVIIKKLISISGAREVNQEKGNNNANQ